jgi:signal transduction histidine kinase
MEQLIDELLVLARAGAAVTGTEPTSLAAVAERAADTVRLDAARLEVPDGIVECDSERLRTLLETLFRNALEHGTGTGSPRPDAPADGLEERSANPSSDPGGGSTDPNGEPATPPLDVRIGPLLEGGFYVGDDGVGVPPRAATGCSNPASRRPRTGRDRVRAGDRPRIVDAHGWSIAVAESRAGGARFEFYP